MTNNKLQKLDGVFDKMERYTKVRLALQAEGYNPTWRHYVPWCGDKYFRLEAFVANSGPVVIVQQYPDDYGIEVYRPITEDQRLDALFEDIKKLRQEGGL